MRLDNLGYHIDFVGAVIGATGLFILGMLSGSWAAKGEWLAWCILGIVIWTLVEYIVHRWLYHSVDYFIAWHEEHHESPNEYIGAPPLIVLALIFVVFYLPVAPISASAAGGLTAGFLVGYAMYQVVHHADHFWLPKSAGYLYHARLRHAVHHFHPELSNFGITTSFWDLVFCSTANVHRGPSKRGTRRQSLS